MSMSNSASMGLTPAISDSTDSSPPPIGSHEEPPIPPATSNNRSSAGTGADDIDNVHNNNNNNNNNGGSSSSSKRGSLTAEVLSAYDLPYSEPPLCVTLNTNTQAPMVLRTGPPLVRHKNRNSFRFSSFIGNNNNNTTTTTAISPTHSSKNANTIDPAAGNDSIHNEKESILQVVAPLRELYHSIVTIKVVYANKTPLETQYDLKQLRIGESKWLILNLTPASTSAASASDSQMVAKGSGDGAMDDYNDDEDGIPPTIRIKLNLKGPYRPEIAALVSLVHGWFGIVDGMEYNLQQVWDRRPKLPVEGISGFLVIPAVPILAAIVVASPVIAGTIMVGLPFLLPLVLVVITIVIGGLLFIGSIFVSTRIGRDQVGGLLAPFVDSLLSSNAGQTLVYDTGPRPTPVSVAKQILPTSMWGKLTISLFLDLIGSASYLLPLVGEGFDIAWAPLQTIFIMAMYDQTTPNLKYVSFMEEILPFTDIIPSASIGFLCEYIPQLLGDTTPDPEVADAVQKMADAAFAKTVVRTPKTANGATLAKRK